MAPAAGGGSPGDFSVKRHRFYRRGHLGVEKSGHDRVDLDMVRGEFDSQRFRELYYGAFRRTVSGNYSRPEQRIHAGDVDDLAAFSLQHGERGGLRHQKHRSEIDVKSFLPAFAGLLQGRFEDANSRVIYQDVHRTEGPFNLRKGGVALGVVGHVHAKCCGGDTDGAKLGEDRRVLCFVASEDGDGCSGSAKTEGHAASEAAVAAGQECDVAAEIERIGVGHERAPEFACSYTSKRPPSTAMI